MNPNPTPDAGLTPVTNNLLETMQQEQAALSRLDDFFEQQLDALRERRNDLLEQTTQEVNEQVHALERLRQARERQARLLGRVLKLDGETAAVKDLAEALRGREGGKALAHQLLEARTAIRERAERTRKRCDDFEFALQYATRIGREMLQVIQELDTPPPARLYTASGDPTHTKTPHSFLNRVG